MSELDLRRSGPVAKGPQALADVLAWRKGERERLLAARMNLSQAERAACGAAIAERLDQAAGGVSGRTIGLYWPFRGEPDLRGWAARVIERGGRIALPVILRKAHPLVFRAWAPGDRLERGAWNIPIPANGEEVQPDVVVSPLVGFDAENYRLGYGGGFYDRTLAAMSKKPLVIGVGYEITRLSTIRPQAFDVPMDCILTEAPEA